MVIGIDLGTTNCAAAYLDENKQAKIINNSEGDRTTPSVILFDDDTKVVGMAAKQSITSDPLNSVQFVKRQIGNKNYKFIDEEGDEYTAEELSAIILKKIKKDAEDFLGQEVNDAVITVPAYFDDSQRKATIDAGTIAGLNVIRVINEPTAAAIAYGINGKCDNENVMVYDLGGGTFDVTIINYNKKKMAIKATGGDRNLGGFDFDNKIIEYAINEFLKEYSIDIYDEEEALSDLREKAENLKKILSNRSKGTLNISCQGKVLKLSVEREQFNDMILSYIDRTIFIMENVLKDAGLNWSDIDRILLVGGSTRVKKVSEMIEKVSGIKPSLDLNPDEAVALGAAYEAEIIENISSSFTKVDDVNSHSLGTIVFSSKEQKEKNSIILKRNTPLPAKVIKEFNTLCDNQADILLRLTEGEDEDPEYVKIIGSAKIKLPQKPKGYKFKIVLSYDENSIIHVDVVDSESEQSLGNIVIDRSYNLNDKEVLEKIDKISKTDIE